MANQDNPTPMWTWGDLAKICMNNAFVIQPVLCFFFLAV